MKRIVFVILIAALLCACASGAKEPVVEIDTRAEQTSAPQETPESVAVETPVPTEPPAEEPPAEEPTAEPAAQEEQSYAERVAAAWEAEGYLEGFAAYSEDDLLDLYGIDLSACISAVGYAETAGYTKEFVLVEADEATAAEIYTLLSNHLAMMTEQFRSYDAAACALVENAVLTNENGIVLMIVSPDAEAMQRIAAEIDR